MALSQPRFNRVVVAPRAPTCAAAPLTRSTAACSRGCSVAVAAGGCSQMRMHPLCHASTPTRKRGPTAPSAVKDGAVADATDSSTLKDIADITRAVEAALKTTLDENVEAAKAPIETPSSDLRGKVARAVERLSTGLLERETEVRMCHQPGRFKQKSASLYLAEVV